MSKEFESTATWKVDITQLKASMQEAKRSITMANSEFKKATAGMDSWSKSTTGVEAKIKQLDTVLEKQKSILKDLNKQYEITAKELGEASPEAERLKIQINNQEAAINKTEKQLKQYNNSLKDLEKAEKEANTPTAKLTKTIEEQQKNVDELKRAYKDSLVGKNPEEAKKLKAELAKASKELKESKDKMTAAEQAADKLDKSLDDVANSAGGKTTDGFTVLKGALANLVADGIRRAAEGFKDLIQIGIDYESSFANVKKTVDGTPEQLNKLNSEIRGMAKEMPQSASDIAEVAAAAGQLGIQVDNISDFTKTMIMLGDSTNLSSDEAASALAKFANVTQMSADDYSKLGSVIVALGNNFATTEADIVDMGQNLASAGSQIGLSHSDIMALATALSSVGMEAQAGGTAFSKLMIDMQLAVEKGGGRLNEFSRIAGMSATEFQKAFKEDAVTALQAFIAGLGDTERNGDSAIKILDEMGITETRLRDSILRAVQAKDTFNDAVTMGRSAWESDTALQNEAQQRYETTASKIEILKNNVKDLGITLFEKLKPHIEKVIDVIKNLVNNEGALKKLAVAFGLVGGALVSAFAVTKLANFITGLQTIIGTLKNLKVAMEASAVATKLLSVAMKALPWVALAAGVAALAAGIVHWINKQKEAWRAEVALTEEQKRQIDTIHEHADAYRELAGSRQQALDASMAEFGYLEQLQDEYNSLIDSSGKVKAGYEDRANFILNQLAQSMGMELEDIRALIDENGRLGESIDKVIEKKKAEAALSAMEDEYKTAIKERNAAFQEYQGALDLVTERTNMLKQSEEDLATARNAEERNRAKEHIKQNTEELERANTALGEATSRWEGYNSTIQNYEGLSSAIISGDQKKIEDALIRSQYQFKTAETATVDSLRQQVRDYEQYAIQIETAIKNGTPGIDRESANQAWSMVNAARQELDKAAPQAAQAANNTGSAFTNTLGSFSTLANKAGGEIGKAGAKGANGAGNLFTQAGKAGIGNYNSAILSGKSEAYRKAYQVALAGGEGFKANNPYPAGSQDAKDYDEGILAGKEQAKKNAETVAGWAEDGFKSKSAWNIGYNLTAGFAAGIKNPTDLVWGAASSMVDLGLAAMREKGLIKSPSRATMKIGDFMSQGLAVGIKQGFKGVISASESLANTTIDAMADALGIHSPSTVARDKIGANIGKGVVDGLNSYNKKTREALQNNIKSWWAKIDSLNRQKSRTSNNTTKRNIDRQIKELKSKISTAEKDITNLTKSYNSNVISRAQTRLSDLQRYDRITLEQEVTYWEKIVASLRKGSNGYSKAYSEATGELKLAKRAYSDYLTQKDNDLVSNLNSKISYLQNLDKISVAQEVDYWNKLIKTLKKGTQAYKDAEVALYQAKKNIRTTSQELAATFTESVGTIKKELSDNVQGIKDQLANDIRGLLDTYTDAVLDRKKQLTNAWGSLFSSINLSPKVSSGKLTENLQLQVDALKAYDKTLSSLEKKLGVNSDIVAELRDQGIDSLHTMQSLDEMTTRELNNYVKLYEQRASIAGKRATKENSQLKKDTNAEIAELKKTANAEIKQLQTDANKQIKELTRTFKSGLKELGASVKGTSKDVGKQITAGIKAGISEGMKDLTGSLRTQTKSLVDTVKKQLKIKSPSQVFRDEIGKMMPPGIAQGFTLAMPKAESEMQQALNEAVNGLKSSVAESTSNIIPFNSNGVGGMSGSSNTTNNQVVNFNQTINSPKAVDRLTLYRQTNSLLFGAKVRLNNV